jgi:dephospho-CoA kinase
MTHEQSTGRGRPLRIGITGPIGCGKSTVAGWLEELGAVVIDADRVARDVTAPGEATLEAVIERFGETYRTSDGSLDRAGLGRLVFSDPDALADLERIIHPAVRSRIYEALVANEVDGVELEVIEAIKLVEGGLAEMCDEVWLVSCDPAVQRSRLVGRGSTTEDAEQRIDAQAGLMVRVSPAATRTIDTSGSAAATRAVVEGALVTALGPTGDPPPA